MTGTQWGPVIVLASIVLQYVALVLVPSLGPNGKMMAYLVALVAMGGCVTGVMQTIDLLYRGHAATMAWPFRLAQGGLYVLLTARLLFLLAVGSRSLDSGLFRAVLQLLLLAGYSGGLAYLVTMVNGTVLSGATVITAVHVVAVLVLAPLGTYLFLWSPSTYFRHLRMRRMEKMVSDVYHRPDDKDLGPE